MYTDREFWNGAVLKLKEEDADILINLQKTGQKQNQELKEVAGKFQIEIFWNLEAGNMK